MSDFEDQPLRQESDPFSYLLQAAQSSDCYHWSLLSLFSERRGTPTLSERIDIDDEIKKLSTSSPKISSRFSSSLLAEIGPHFFGRWLLQEAIRLAVSRPAKDLHNRREQLSVLDDKLIQTRVAIKSCVELIESQGGCPDGESGLPWDRRSKRWKRIIEAEENLARAVSAIDFLLAATKDDLKFLDIGSGRPREEWKTLFVETLAIGWDLLTGQLPRQTTTSGPFVDFVHAAWNSIPGGGVAPTINWERPIRTGTRRAKVLCDEIAQLMVTDRDYLDELRRVSRDEKALQEERTEALRQLRYYTDPFRRLGIKSQIMTK